MDIQVTTVPVSCFYEWMDRRKKLGGQNKFPRVLKETQRDDWTTFLAERGVTSNEV